MKEVKGKHEKEEEISMCQTAVEELFIHLPPHTLGSIYRKTIS